MQHVRKNRFSATLSAFVTAALLMGSLPLAHNASALVPTLVGFDGAVSSVTTEGNIVNLTIKATSGGSPTSLFEGDLSYTVTGTADASSDFLFNGASSVTGGTVHMDNNTLSLPITLIDDGATEGPESITVTLTDISTNKPATSIGSNHTFTIVIDDNNGLPYINVSSAISAGSENQPGLVRVTLSRPATNSVQFGWSTDVGFPTASDNPTIIGGTTFPADYTNGQIAFKTEIIPAGQTYFDINLGVQEDNLYEQTESVNLLLDVNSSDAQLGSQAEHTYFIVDNDTPTAGFAAASSDITEGPGQQTYSYEASLSKPSDRDINVIFETEQTDTATYGSDWELQNSFSALIPAGTLTATINITVFDDTDTEADETATVFIKDISFLIPTGPNRSHTFVIKSNDGYVEPAVSGTSGTAIPQSTASAGGAPVVTAPTAPTTPTTPATPTQPEQNSGEVLGVQTSLLHELIAKLKFGSTSNEVTQLQVELQKLGFFPAKAKTTRFYGAVTKATVQKYLDTKANEISLPDLAAMLKLGQRGAAVKKLQTELKAAGFFPASTATTGFYGTTTKQAVAKYLAR